ncbi:MAG: hypothetical protein L3J19_05190 [Sulfurimonas sp.]|nr:hypothetical protein [Sulfurimonas sp.]
MKPLPAEDLPTFLKRFGNFVDSEFRHIEIISPTIIKIILAGQDSARGFDWITVGFEFSGIGDARLLDNSKLSHVDMSEGINIIYEDDMYGFGTGNCTSLSSIKSSTLFIVSKNIKYQENIF